MSDETETKAYTMDVYCNWREPGPAGSMFEVTREFPVEGGTRGETRLRKSILFALDFADAERMMQRLFEESDHKPLKTTIEKYHYPVALSIDAVASYGFTYEDGGADEDE